VASNAETSPEAEDDAEECFLVNSTNIIECLNTASDSSCRIQYSTETGQLEMLFEEQNVLTNCSFSVYEGDLDAWTFGKTESKLIMESEPFYELLQEFLPSASSQAFSGLLHNSYADF
jgi:hypothetical protein